LSDLWRFTGAEAVTWILGSEERLLPPDDFQERLTDIGGLNIYDEPCFKIMWGQTATHRTAGYSEYKDTLIMFNDASWGLFEWQPSEVYGTPESWYVQNYDDISGLCLMGEYPYDGKYKLLFNLSHRYMENGEMTIFRFPLSDMLLEQIVPLIIEAQGVSVERQEAYRKTEDEMREYEISLQIEGIRRNAKLAFAGGAISYTNQGVRTSVIDQKVQQLSMGWQKAAERLMKAGRGPSQGEL
jgi:hypothetical protein